MKICTRCKVEKNLSCFSKRTKSKDGLSFKCRECASILNKKWFKRGTRDPVKNSVNAKNWRKNNRKHINEYQREYAHKNPLFRRIRFQKRKARKLLAGGSFNKRDIDFLLKSQKNRCISCPESLKRGYHIDHIIPLSKGGSNDRKNIQLLCQPCNNQKYNKDPVAFMQQKGFLL